MNTLVNRAVNYARAIHAHPMMSEALKEAALAVGKSACEQWTLNMKT